MQQRLCEGTGSGGGCVQHELQRKLRPFCAQLADADAEPADWMPEHAGNCKTCCSSAQAVRGSERAGPAPAT